MSLLTLLVVLLAVGLALWLVRLGATYLALDPWLVRAAYVGIIAVAVIFLCRALGVFALLSSVRI